MSEFYGRKLKFVFVDSDGNEIDIDGPVDGEIEIIIPPGNSESKIDLSQLGETFTARFWFEPDMRKAKQKLLAANIAITKFSRN